MNDVKSFVVKLIAAVKKHKCLYYEPSRKNTFRTECEEAWQLVANECNASVDFCKKNWKTIRICFFEGLRCPENRNFYHDHLQFLNISHSTTSDVSISQDNNTKVDSTNRSQWAGNSSENMQRSNIIEEIEKKSQFSDAKRYTRSCKRSLESVIPYALPEEEQGKKRFCNNGNQNIKPQFSNKPVKVRLQPVKKAAEVKCQFLTEPVTATSPLSEEKMPANWQFSNNLIGVEPELSDVQTKAVIGESNINSANSTAESVKTKITDHFIFTDLKTRDFATQYEFNPMDLDGMFIRTIKTHLYEMNARQKMNFKRKVYNSLLEVFDDGADFCNRNEILAPKQSATVVDITTGETHLLRELVSLVQAAKYTPEIIYGKDKVQPNDTNVQRIPPDKISTSIMCQSSDFGKSPISLSTLPDINDDDGDVQFFIDNPNDKNGSSLPGSSNEIKEKTTDSIKVTDMDTAVLPRTVVKKVIKAGESRGGNKKRIFCIVPNSMHLTSTNNNNSSGIFYASSKKKPKKLLKITDNTDNTCKRYINNKRTDNTKKPPNSINVSSKLTNCNTANSDMNSKIVIKKTNTSNHALDPTVRYCKKFSLSNTTTPFAVPTKVVPELQKVQARFSTSNSSLSDEGPNFCSPIPKTSTPRSSISSNYVNPQVSSISQIKISKSTTAGSKLTNPQMASNSLNISSNIKSKLMATPVKDTSNPAVKGPEITTSIKPHVATCVPLEEEIIKIEID